MKGISLVVGLMEKLILKYQLILMKILKLQHHSSQLLLVCKLKLKGKVELLIHSLLIITHTNLEIQLALMQNPGIIMNFTNGQEI